MRIIFTAALVLVSGSLAFCQDIPLFTQKLTNSFIYNPSLAGQDVGSFTLTHRSNYSGVEGAPSNNFISAHTPVLNHRFGVGGNFFQENVTALTSTYYSGAFAYHLRFNRLSSLSFGVGAEYNNVRLSGSVTEINDGTDEILNRYQNGVSTPDFSFGMSFRNRSIRGGISANRLRTAWTDNEASINLSAFYSAYLQGSIHASPDHLLEPYAAYRKFSEESEVLDLGLFYTYKSKLILGAAMRSGTVASATLGYMITKKMMLGVSSETILSPVGGYAGLSNEFVLRLDFNDRADQKRFRADYKSAVTQRRKTYSSSRNSAAHKSPAKFHKSMKKSSAFSPNSRYQNLQKLSGGKKSSTKKYKKKNTRKRKPKRYGRRG